MKLLEKVKPSIMGRTSKSDVFVDFEYGKLQEVLLGWPLLVYPDIKEAPWLEEALKVLPDEEAQKFRERSGKTSSDFSKFAEMEKENQELIKILKKFGVKIHRPQEFTASQLIINFGEKSIKSFGATQQYARDPIAVIGNNVIELAVGTPFRRADSLGWRKLFIDRLIGSNANWFQMPMQDWSSKIKKGLFNKNSAPVIEGGDVFVLGKKIFVGTTENPVVGSSRLGYEWLTSILQPQGYDVERIIIKENFLHLDVALSIPKPGVAIICPDAFSSEVPAYFENWRIIKVGVSDAQHLACNGMPIDTKNYILPVTKYSKYEYIQHALEEEEITVYPIEFSNHTEDGGAIRCSTHPLVRKLESSSE
jgi:N-dimethylarginine dimethylaminohydrolase